MFGDDDYEALDLLFIGCSMIAGLMDGLWVVGDEREWCIFNDS